MKNIALVNLRYKIDIDFERKESLALGYLSAILIKHGYDVDVIDAQFCDLNADEVFGHIKKKKYAFIGISLYQETVSEFDQLYHLLKESNIKSHICLGGQFPTFTAGKLLKKYPLINSIVIGEGEVTLLNLVKCIPTESWKKINGICYIDDNKIVYTDPQNLIDDIDVIPWPNRTPYYSMIKNKSTFSSIISASRGCYANCSFCSIQSFYGKLIGKKLRIRNPEKVVDEIEHINKTYGIDNFFFADDNFLTTNKVYADWVDKFLDELEQRNLNINFDVDCRVDDIDIELFKKLKRHGLRGVFLGVESFNQRALNLLNKRVTVQDNINAIIKLKKLRLNVWMGFIMFDMFTTLNEIRENVKVLNELRYFKYMNYDRPISSDWVASILLLYNGTPLLEKMKSEHYNLLISNDLGYKFTFKYDKTNIFYTQLKKWKIIAKRMINLDTLNTIKLANKLSAQKEAQSLHFFSRKYMLLDRRVFLQILDMVDSNNLNQVDKIIDDGAWEFQQLAEKINTISSNLYTKINRYDN